MTTLDGTSTETDVRDLNAAGIDVSGARTSQPETQPIVSNGAILNRDRLYARLVERPLPGISQGEVDTHFREMPARYWERIHKAELIWGLQIVHRFLDSPNPDPTRNPVVSADSRPYPERGLTKVMVCSQDRPGLLAKIAAAFNALRINILRADVYTRSDGLALDVFEVCNLEQDHTSTLERLRQFLFLVEGALTEPPRFASVWAGQFHKALPRRRLVTARVNFDNDSSPDYTMILVQASDRPGLLHDLLRGMAEAGLNIAEAAIETERSLAVDVFFVTDLSGRKIWNASRLERIRKALVRSLR